MVAGSRGGGVLRAMIWGVTDDSGRATRVAAAFGRAAAYGLIGCGALLIVNGHVGDGLWGRTTAGMVMKPLRELSSVPPSARAIDVWRLMLEERLYMLPVLQEGEWLGAVTRESILAFTRSSEKSSKPELGGRIPSDQGRRRRR